MKYILQIFTGAWHAPNWTSEEIIKKIEGIAARITIDKVIIGWNTDKALYGKFGAYLRSSGIKMLLWLPVFSEISGIARPDEALDIFGNTIVPHIKQEGEDFAFCCPSSSRNIQIVKDIYEEYFSDCMFDGVFLDKIRGQSFVSDVPGVLSCGCERCEKAFRGRGVDLEEVRNACTARKDSFFDMSAYPMNGRFKLTDARAQSFFEAKASIITDTVAEISGYFRDKGMTVGLDLFAPVISGFVGQDYPSITKCADFIKPMLYRRTEAPAGISYEYALFEKNAPEARGRISLIPDMRFLCSQLEAVKGVECEVYPGIEINYREDIAKTDPDYIIESLRAVKDYGYDGATLCWNVMLAPEAHIEAIARLEKDWAGSRIDSGL